MGIRAQDGSWLDQPVDIGQIFFRYYTDLFSSSNPPRVQEALLNIPQVVTKSMNFDLVGAFHEWEVVAALKQMAPLKALGFDGMSPLFYLYFWPMVDFDVTSSILSWLNTGTLPSPVNHTFITLIPKISSPELVSEFCPISLCNVLYRVFSKVPANRLKKFLPTLITKNQSAFAKYRLISDNIIIAFETLDSMKTFKSR